MSLNQLMKKNSKIVSIYQFLINNIDFTNPVKRMEFDEQRKRQQMKELANVSDNNYN